MPGKILDQIFYCITIFFLLYLTLLRVLFFTQDRYSFIVIKRQFSKMRKLEVFVPFRGHNCSETNLIRSNVTDENNRMHITLLDCYFSFRSSKSALASMFWFSFLEICSTNSRDSLIKLIISSLDYSRDGIARILLAKVLSGSPFVSFFQFPVLIIRLLYFNTEDQCSFL